MPPTPLHQNLTDFVSVAEKILLSLESRRGLIVARDWCGREISGGELAQRALALAQRMQDEGVGVGTVVAVCVPRSIESVIAYLGAMCSGAATVLVDPEMGARRREAALNQIEPRIVVTLDYLAVTPPYCPHFELPDMAPTEPCVIVFTSGSGGPPKAIELPHQALLNRLEWGQSEYPLRNDDVILSHTSYSFDFSLWELLAPLAYGGMIQLASPGESADPDYLVRCIREFGVTVGHFVPSYLSWIVSNPEFAALGSLRLVFSGGESLPFDLMRRFLGSIDATLYNQYGPAETCVDSTFWRCVSESESSTVPIGRPIANTRVEIVNTEGRPVNAGEIGEIWIAGVGLANRYLNDPDATSRGFVTPVAGPLAGTRFYRSGDLAYRRSDGELVYAGRLDDQVKVNGVRVEPSEIESWIRRIPGVTDAVVLAETDGATNMSLTAFYSGDAAAAEMPRSLEPHLLTAMIPKLFVWCETLPRLPSGKADRQALKLHLQSMARSKTDECDSSHLTPWESRIAEIWHEVLGIRPSEPNASFFDLGGHSLLAAMMLSRLQTRHGATIRLREVFRHPTLGELATLLDQEVPQ